MSHLDNYEPGVRCEACSAHFPVSVFHPVDRPCDKVELPRRDPRCFCRSEGPPYAGCPVHGEYPG